MTMMKYLLSVALLLFASTAVLVKGDCLVGDIMYMPGQSTGYFGYACINGTHFEGSESVCGDDGTLVDQDVVLACSESVPNCVQCGTPEMGEALCLSTTDVPDNCDDSHVGPPRPDDTAGTTTEGGGGGCLVGDIMYQTGDSIGVRGFSCINETHYDGSEAFCQADGTIEDQPTVLECPASANVPFCVQCGTPETGEALCLGSADVPDYCADHVGPPRPESDPTDESDEPASTTDEEPTDGGTGLQSTPAPSRSVRHGMISATLLLVSVGWTVANM